MSAEVNNEPQFNSDHFDDEVEINIGELISVLLENRWLIGSITIVVFLLGVYQAFVAIPVYRADALLQVEENKSSGLGGLDVNELFAGNAAVSAEIEIVRSRTVLGAVVDNLNLEIIAAPEYLPYIGEALARQLPEKERPRVKVDVLESPGSVSRRGFKLVALGAEKYELFDDEGTSLGMGVVGESLTVPVAGGESMSILVSTLIGENGQAYNVWRSTHSSAISGLQGSLSVSEQGDWSGILAITLTGYDRAGVQQQLNEIADVYVDQSKNRKSAEVQQTLDFLDLQMPAVRSGVEAAELALNAFRLEKGSVDLPLETQSILETIVAVERQLNEIRQEREKVTLAFTPAHPTVIALDRQIERHNNDLAELGEQIRDLPTTQQDFIRLIRDVEANTALYTSLLNTSQELRVVKAGTIANVRIVDPAELPIWPISPNRTRMALLGLILGVFLGVAAAFAKRALKAGVENPDRIEQQVKIPVYASISYSKRQEEIYEDQLEVGRKQALLVADSPDDLAIESLRNLQTALHFGMMDAKNNCIMIAGPSPAVGKSFISANLAAVLTSNGKNVLLVDGDMRQGHLHKFLGLAKENGLSELISGEIPIEQAMHSTPIAGLTLMPTGKLPPNPAELLFHKRFGESMAALIPQYDHVIIDSPPILAATDASIIGQVAGATLMVLRSGQHPMREIEQSVKRLQRAAVNLRGLVINGVTHSQRYGAGKYMYQYAYKGK